MDSLFAQGKEAKVEQKAETEEAATAAVTEEATEEPSENNSSDENEENTTTDGNSLLSTAMDGGPLMIFILILALFSLTLIIERIIYFTRNKIWTGNQLVIDLREAADNIKTDYREDLEDELRNEFKIYAHGVERGMSLLSGIGNISPIVGFLGTVIGMIEAFAAIAAATTVNAKVVAVGIKMALVTTAGGLCVAAPTLAFYYLFIHVLQNRYANADEIITDISESLPRFSDKLK